MARATKPPKRNSWANAVGSSPDIIEAVYVDTGWPAPGATPVIPPRGNFNFEQHRYDEGLNYLMQRGFADWASDETDYGTFDCVRDTDGKVYQLLGTATTGVHPNADATNWYLWRRTPRPMPADTFVDEIDAWRNKNGFRITGKDHFGYDCGKIFDFREDWNDGSAAQKTATAVSTLWFGRWNYAIDNGGGTAGQISANGVWQPDLNTHPWGPILGVTAFGQSVNAVSIVETAKTMIKMSAASLVYEADFSVNGASGPQSNTVFQFGLGDGSLAANRTMGTPVPSAYGFWLESSTGANWRAISKPNGGGQVVTDTGVATAKDAPHRYRCVVVGTSDSDDGNARVLQFIDGVLKDNTTTNLGNQVLSPFFRAFANQGEVCLLNVGPLRVQMRLELGDILI